MKHYSIALLSFFIVTFSVHSQSISQLMNEVRLDSLTKKVNELTGEVSTVVNGNTVTIINRQQANNDVAADYIKQKFEELDNLTITDQAFNTNGRNIIATQLGKTNPENIYIVCAHYDSVADYCASDNASGTAAVLEIARILSTQCTDNTIVYALWDEEEIGLRGANFYAGQAAANGDNILGVLNIDMMGYDGDDDNDFDIDVRNIANSIAMKDDIITVLNTPEYGFTLNVNVVNPGTAASDHSRFWANGFSAVLVGEAWSINDETPFYHTSNDRIATLNLPYYHELTKLIFAYMATKAGLTNADSTVDESTTSFTANQIGATYQWFDCDTKLPIDGAINRVFSPNSTGNYFVKITSENCTETSTCFFFDTLGLPSFTEDEVTVFPNPVRDELKIETSLDIIKTLKLYDISGKLTLTKESTLKSIKIDTRTLSNGVYFLTVKMLNKSGTYKIVKE
uniref:M28 family peptidase n=1 Tax=Gelidibacter sp. TaxID=2018083 RepID=UPI00404911BE